MDVVYYTNRGGREINEDSLFMTDGAYVVCDGLGGHASGEVASNCAVKVMAELCANTPPYNPELINTFFLRANQAVIALEEQALTTIVGCFVRNGLLYYQSVGDSRFYYFRDGKKFAQTKDDSVCQAAVDLGTMDYEDIRTSEDRSRLLKVLGNDPGLKIMRQYEPVRMQGGDAFLVCSDGFWEHVLDNEMEETLAQSSDAEEWLNRMLKIQYSRAKNRDDNYTVICCIVEDKDAAADGPSDADSGEKPDTPYNVPYEGSFRRYTENENVTLSYDADGLPERSRDSRQEEAGSGFDGYDEEYYDDEYEDYDEKPKKRGFFARLFGR